MSYSFGKQLKIGQEAERIVCAWLCSQGRTVRDATPDEQRAGIDLCVSGDGGANRRVEVKADTWAAETGNAAMEVVQVSTTGDPGWVWTCQADWLLFCVTGTGECLWLRPSDVRDRALRDWRCRVKRRELRVLHTQNDGYQTINWLVPLSEVRDLAVMSCDIPDLVGAYAEYVAARK